MPCPWLHSGTLFDFFRLPHAPCRLPSWRRRGRSRRVGIRWLRRAWSDPASQKRRFAPRPARLRPDRGRFPRLGKMLLGDFAAVPPGSRAGPLPFVAEKEDSTPNLVEAPSWGERVWSVGSGAGWRVWKGRGWWRSGSGVVSMLLFLLFCSPWGLQVVVVILLGVLGPIHAAPCTRDAE